MDIINKYIMRTISKIAYEIKQDWKNVYFGAIPYLDAMATLEKITDDYYQDSAASVIAYFLANAATWRGKTARRVKMELNDLLKDYYEYETRKYQAK